MNSTATNEVLIRVQATPNPNAWKFVLDRPVLLEGKVTYADEFEAMNNLLASSLFEIKDVRQVHFFQNVVVVTHSFDADPEEVQRDVCAVIQTRIHMHDPSQTKVDEQKKAREGMSPELLAIEELLDRTVRPGLQGDGGNLTVLKLDGDKLYVRYEGACGTCPSSTAGTLMAIEGILRDELNPNLEVVPV